MATDSSKPDRTGHGSVWLLPATGPQAGLRRGVIYELFLLGELMSGPLHGYLLREILNRILGPFRQMSWGALYPLIHRLEQAGMIVPDPPPPETAAAERRDGRPRHSFRITDLGKQRFTALMDGSGTSPADEPELFVLKLNYFGHISRVQQASILHRYYDHLQIEADYLQTAQQGVTVRAGIPDGERRYILRMLNYRLHGLRAQQVWIAEEIGAVAGPG